MINRQNNLKKLEFNEIIPPERNSSFCDLMFYMEYFDDTPMIEREREERSPRLSANFLTKHINPEQRRLVVAFMIRIGVSEEIIDRTHMIDFTHESIFL